MREHGDEVHGIDRERDVTNERSMHEVFEWFRPDVTFHLAALTHVGDSWDQAEEFTRINVVGTQRVLEASFAANPAAMTVLVSSSEVYGVTRPEDQPLRESFRLAPANPYSASKVEAERVAHEALRVRGQRVVIARPFNHLGPGQSVSFVVPALVSRLLEAAAHGDSSRFPSGTSRLVATSATYATSCARIASSPNTVSPARLYNVASGVDVALGDIAARLVAELAPSVELVVDPALLRPTEVPVSRGSAQKIHEATGWAPMIALSTTLKDVIDDQRARLRET